MAENHTCTTAIDWSGLQPASDLASYLTAAEKVEARELKVADLLRENAALGGKPGSQTWWLYRMTTRWA